jgi:hypothetical protein
VPTGKTRSGEPEKVTADIGDLQLGRDRPVGAVGKRTVPSRDYKRDYKGRAGGAPGEAGGDPSAHTDLDRVQGIVRRRSWVVLGEVLLFMLLHYIMT